MKKENLDTILQIVQSKIIMGADFEEIKSFILSTQNEDVFLELQDDIENYLEVKNKKLPNILLQPTGDDTKEIFQNKQYTSWAEKEEYEYIWEKCKGNKVLFIKNNFIFAIATIEDIKEDYESNKEYPLRYIWNDNIQFVNIPMSAFNIILGYNEKYTPRKFMLINRESLEDATKFINKYLKC